MFDLDWDTLRAAAPAGRPDLVRSVPAVNRCIHEAVAAIAASCSVALGPEHAERAMRHLANDMLRVDSLRIDATRIRVHNQVQDWRSASGDKSLAEVWAHVSAGGWIRGYVFEALCRGFDLQNDGHGGLEAVALDDAILQDLRNSYFKALQPLATKILRRKQGDGGVYDFFGYCTVGWDRLNAARAKFLGLCSLSTHLHVQIKAFRTHLRRENQSKKPLLQKAWLEGHRSRSVPPLGVTDADFLGRLIQKVAREEFAGIELVRIYADCLVGILEGTADHVVFAELLRSCPDLAVGDLAVGDPYALRKRFLVRLGRHLERAGFESPKAEVISAGSGGE